MRLKLGIVGILVVVITITIFVGIMVGEENKYDDTRVFHVTLANPELYVNGMFSEEFILESGNYYLRFVPNGYSPEILTIVIIGKELSAPLLEENFELEGTPHTTEIAQYYTWKYIGDNILVNPQTQMVQITINPNENFLGPVSVSLIKK